MHPSDAGLRFRPHIPAHWGMLQLPIRWRGTQLRVTARAGGAVKVLVEAGNAVRVAIGDGPWHTVAAGAALGG